MDGYTERFDFEKGLITGWAFDKLVKDNSTLRITAYYDNEVIGWSTPSESRADLAAMSDQPMVYSISCDRTFTAMDLVSGRLEVSAEVEDRKLVLKRTQLGDETLRRTAAQQIWHEQPISLGNHRCEIWAPSELKKVHGSVDAGRMTEMILPVGLSSDDGSAMIGENGQLFLMAAPTHYSHNTPVVLTTVRLDSKE